MPMKNYWELFSKNLCLQHVVLFVWSLAYEFNPAKNSPGLGPLLLAKVFLLSWDTRKWQPP